MTYCTDLTDLLNSLMHYMYIVHVLYLNLLMSHTHSLQLIYTENSL